MYNYTFKFVVRMLKSFAILLSTFSIIILMTQQNYFQI